MATVHRWPDKDPSDLLDYALDVAGEIDPDSQQPTGDSVATAVWVIQAGLTKIQQAESGTVAVLWLDGGTDGREYKINCTITSAQGRRVNRDILIKVAEQ